MNLSLKSYTFCLYFNFIIYLYVWIRIHKSNTDPDPQHCLIRNFPHVPHYLYLVSKNCIPKSKKPVPVWRYCPTFYSKLIIKLYVKRRRFGQFRIIVTWSSIVTAGFGGQRKRRSARIRFVVCDVCGSALKFELHPDPFQNVCGSEIPYY